MICIHRPIKSELPEEDESKLVILPAIHDDVGARVQNKEQVRQTSHQTGPSKLKINQLFF